MKRADKALTKRGQVWWLIMTVPEELRATLGTARIRQSLRTRDKRVALARADAIIDELQRQLVTVSDASTPYLDQLRSLRGVSTADAEHVLEALQDANPALSGDGGMLEPSEVPEFFALRTHARGLEPPLSLQPTMLSVAHDLGRYDPSRRIERTLAAVKQFGNDVPIVSVTRRLVRDMLDTWDVSAGTKKLALAELSVVYRHAMRIGVIEFTDTTPFQKWNLRVNSTATAYMDDDTFALVWRYLPRHRLLLALCRLHGFRTAETDSIELDVIDGVHVMRPRRSKTSSGRDRAIPIHTRMDTDEIRERIREGLLEPLKARRALSNMKSTKPELSSLPSNVNLHSLRVCAATDMASAGVREEVISRLLGHSGNITSRYIANYDVHELKHAIDSIRVPPCIVLETS